MPFVEQPAAEGPGGAADGLAYDVITRLAKLRSLFVIAPGTVFALTSPRHRRRRGGARAATSTTWSAASCAATASG